MILRITLICFVLLSVAITAQADYVEVRRDAIARAEPTRESDVAMALRPATYFLLIDDEQNAGFYRIDLGNGRSGWVYRTFVRRYPGHPPSISPLSPTRRVVPGPPAWSSSGSGVTLGREVVYGGLPKGNGYENPLTILPNRGFVVGYDEIRRNPAWATYRVHPFERQTTAPRPSSFRADARSPTGVAHGDFTNTGYARGHMAPNYAIFQCYGREAQIETFLATNVCPQFQRFNAGIWETLEDIVANAYGQTLGEVWVICGPTFGGSEKSLRSGIRVPTGFFMIVIDEEAGQPRALAFLFDHVNAFGESPESALRSIDAIEIETGLDFLSELDDGVEAALESTVALELWPYEFEDEE